MFWNLSRQYFFQLNNNIALLLLALNLEIKLGGVALYKNDNPQGEKLRKKSFNDLARQPQMTDIIHANKKIRSMIYLSVFLLLLLAVSAELVAANV